MKSVSKTILALAVLFFSGCGGGGGGGGGGSTGPVTSTLSFSAQSAMQAYSIAGHSKNFTISGTCNGTGSATAGPMTTPVTFEGVSGYSATVTVTLSFTNCTPASIATSLTSYANSTYGPLGFNTGLSSSAANYGIYLVTPIIPTLVKVGDTGIIGTETEYTSSTKGTLYGTSQLSYVVEADTATTAIINVITRGYNTGSVLLYTAQVRYRITSGGVVTPLSEDIQYANGTTTHLVLTYI